MRLESHEALVVARFEIGKDLFVIGDAQSERHFDARFLIAVLHVIINYAILHFLIRRIGVYAHLNVVARVVYEFKFGAVYGVVNVQATVVGVAVDLFFVLVQKDNVGILHAFDEFSQFFHDRVAVIGGILSRRHEEAEHPYVFAVHHRAYFDELFELNELLGETFFVVDTHFAYRRTYGTEGYAFCVELRFDRRHKLLHRIIRYVFAVYISRANIFLSQFFGKLYLLVKAETHFVVKSRNGHFHIFISS